MKPDASSLRLILQPVLFHVVTGVDDSDGRPNQRDATDIRTQSSEAIFVRRAQNFCEIGQANTAPKKTMSTVPKQAKP